MFFIFFPFFPHFFLLFLKFTVQQEKDAKAAKEAAEVAKIAREEAVKADKVRQAEITVKTTEARRQKAKRILDKILEEKAKNLLRVQEQHAEEKKKDEARQEVHAEQQNQRDEDELELIENRYTAALGGRAKFLDNWDQHFKGDTTYIIGVTKFDLNHEEQIQPLLRPIKVAELKVDVEAEIWKINNYKKSLTCRTFNKDDVSDTIDGKVKVILPNKIAWRKDGTGDVKACDDACNECDICKDTTFKKEFYTLKTKTISTCIKHCNAQVGGKLFFDGDTGNKVWRNKEGRCNSLGEDCGSEHAHCYAKIKAMSITREIDLHSFGERPTDCPLEKDWATIEVDKCAHLSIWTKDGRANADTSPTVSVTNECPDAVNCDVRWSNGNPAWTTCVKVAPYKSQCKWENGGCKNKDIERWKCDGDKFPPVSASVITTTKCVGVRSSCGGNQLGDFCLDLSQQNKKSVCCKKAGNDISGSGGKSHIVNFGSSGSNRGYKTDHAAIYLNCPTLVNRDNWLPVAPYGNAGDSFEITTSGNQITARRIGGANGWGLNLKFTCGGKMWYPIKQNLDECPTNLKCDVPGDTCGSGAGARTCCHGEDISIGNFWWLQIPGNVCKGTCFHRNNAKSGQQCNREHFTGSCSSGTTNPKLNKISCNKCYNDKKICSSFLKQKTCITKQAGLVEHGTCIKEEVHHIAAEECKEGWEHVPNTLTCQRTVEVSLCENKQEPLNLVNKWAHYGNGWGSATVAVSKGICVVTGMIKNGKWGHLATLPTNCRPSKHLVFNLNNHEKTSRVDVLSNGVVKWVAGGNSHNWLSLTGITFATEAKFNANNQRAIILSKDWTILGSEYGDVPTVEVKEGLCVVSGTV